ncbi:SubName: Full=Related to SIS2 protein (Cycle-specific gene control) {ECO:0000313/EMBL:CCA75377.1} [Serendipita indica DSM 11827]|nr:SubName: Full=Related to SIS2 protein (Cycle-specific gene control) {ECO:0000313/EMBL:CCA75377.1} [Serendipita indica DSM 11827]
MSTESFTAVANRTPGHVHIVLIATGSVASVKIPLIVKELLQHKRVKIQVVATKASQVFFDSTRLKAEHGVNIWQDEDEWTASLSWKKMGDAILHIELRRWADLVLIAPCSANTLAKLAGGLCDNLATSLLRALPPIQTDVEQASLIADRPGESTRVEVWVFPAMNTLMYEHPLTAMHLKVVKETLKYRVEGPIGKGLACGDVGLGAMTEWKDIVKMVVDHYRLERSH